MEVADEGMGEGRGASRGPEEGLEVAMWGGEGQASYPHGEVGAGELGPQFFAQAFGLGLKLVVEGAQLDGFESLFQAGGAFGKRVAFLEELFEVLQGFGDDFFFGVVQEGVQEINIIRQGVILLDKLEYAFHPGSPVFGLHEFSKACLEGFAGALGVELLCQGFGELCLGEDGVGGLFIFCIGGAAGYLGGFFGFLSGGVVASVAVGVYFAPGFFTFSLVSAGVVAHKRFFFREIGGRVGWRRYFYQEEGWVSLLASWG